MAQAPAHVAIIMDGNGRWAQAQGKPRLEGHRQGAENVRTILRAAADTGVQVVTLYAFSRENWRRPEEEVGGLFNLMRQYFKNELKQLNKEGVRVRFIGNRTPEGGLPQDILDIMTTTEQETAQNDKITAVFAINYSGQDELCRAAAKLQAEGIAQPTSKQMEQALDMPDLPLVDLIIRTAGEQRLSNFLLWQAAYAELMFSDSYWPAYGKEEFLAQLEKFSSRTRRFGQTNEQLAQK